MRRYFCVLVAVWSPIDTAGGHADHPLNHTRIIIPFKLDGGTGSFATVVRDGFRRYLDLDSTLVVEAGGGGSKAWAKMGQRPLDGSEIVVVNLPHVVSQPIFGADYKTADFQICAIASFTALTFMVPVASPYRNFENFVARCRQIKARRPCVVGAAGNWTAQHILVSRLNQEYRANIEYRAYGSAATAYSDMASNRIVDAVLTTAPAAMAQELRHHGRIIGVASEFPLMAIPHAKRLIDANVRLVSGIYRGFAVPAAAPERVCQQVSRELGKLRQTPDFLFDMQREAIDPFFRGYGEALDDFLGTYTDDLMVDVGVCSANGAAKVYDRRSRSCLPCKSTERFDAITRSCIACEHANGTSFLVAKCKSKIEPVRGHSHEYEIFYLIIFVLLGIVVVLVLGYAAHRINASMKINREKKALLAIKRRHDEIMRVLRSVSVPVLVVSASPDPTQELRIELWNHAFEELTQVHVESGAPLEAVSCLKVSEIAYLTRAIRRAVSDTPESSEKLIIPLAGAGGLLWLQIDVMPLNKECREAMIVGSDVTDFVNRHHSLLWVSAPAAATPSATNRTNRKAPPCPATAVAAVHPETMVVQSCDANFNVLFQCGMTGKTLTDFINSASDRMRTAEAVAQTFSSEAASEMNVCFGISHDASKKEVHDSRLVSVSFAKCEPSAEDPSVAIHVKPADVSTLVHFEAQNSSADDPNNAVAAAMAAKPASSRDSTFFADPSSVGIHLIELMRHLGPSSFPDARRHLGKALRKIDVGIESSVRRFGIPHSDWQCKFCGGYNAPDDEDCWICDCLESDADAESAPKTRMSL